MVTNQIALECCPTEPLGLPMRTLFSPHLPLLFSALVVFRVLRSDQVYTLFNVCQPLSTHINGNSADKFPEMQYNGSIADFGVRGRRRPVVEFGSLGEELLGLQGKSWHGQTSPARIELRAICRMSGDLDRAGDENQYLCGGRRDGDCRP